MSSNAQNSPHNSYPAPNVNSVEIERPCSKELEKTTGVGSGGTGHCPQIPEEQKKHLFSVIARAQGRWLEETHWETVSTNQSCLTRKLAALEEGSLISPQSCNQGAMQDTGSCSRLEGKP